MSGVTPEEEARLRQAVKETTGNIAEVGVGDGGTAEVIAKAKKPRRHLYLYDTFTGLPKPLQIDGEFHEGQYAFPYEGVKERLKNYPNVHVFKGSFPNTAVDKRYSFVHLDVDLYQSTKDSIAYFWPRLVKNGIIIVHDYVTEMAVRVAIIEHLVKVNRMDLFEEYKEMPTSQFILIK